MNYPYANGIIKAVENKVFDRNKFLRLLKTDKSDFFETLVELGYGEAGNNVSELIAGELAAVRKLIDEITPEKKLTDLFFLANDAINIKAYYKMKLFSVREVNFFAQSGNLESDVLKKAILEEDYTSLPKVYQKFFKNLEEFKTETNPRILSAKVDNAIFGHIASVLKLRPQNALAVYYRTYVDFQNVLILVRSRHLDWELPRFLEMFINFGSIPYEVFQEAYLKNGEQLVAAFRDYHQEKISKGLKRYLEYEDLDALENYFDRELLETMRFFQNDAFDIGPLLYYYLLKQAEAKNIKIIYGAQKPELSDLIDY
ncbi:MAG: V-type ATPase subunit [Acholeplasmataceae bacterium]|jgi:V/A-type H+-transporting ATPase subunit C|nr:V-type ATPase subunit [Acholeplasmataceae bacterium]